MNIEMKLLTKKLKKTPMNEGFTLIELLIVVLIIGILSAIVVVAVSNTQGEARSKACSADVAAVASALDTYKATSKVSGGGEGDYPTSTLGTYSQYLTVKINGVDIPANYKPYSASELNLKIVPGFLKKLPNDYISISATGWDGTAANLLKKGAGKTGGIVAWYNATLNNTIVTGDPETPGCQNSGI